MMNAIHRAGVLPPLASSPVAIGPPALRAEQEPRDAVVLAHEGCPGTTQPQGAPEPASEARAAARENRPSAAGGPFQAPGRLPAVPTVMLDEVPPVSLEDLVGFSSTTGAAVPVAPLSPDAPPAAGIPEEALAWIALCPGWSESLARNAAFPTGAVDLVASWRTFSRLGLCSMTEASAESETRVSMPDDVRAAVLSDLRNDPQFGQPWINRQMAAAGRAVVEAQLRDSALEISQTVLRWGELAAQATDPVAAAGLIEDRITRLLEQGRMGDAQRTIDAARMVDGQMGHELTPVVGWAQRQFQLASAHRNQERVEHYRETVGEMLHQEPRVTPESLAWVALITQWPADLALGARFPAFNDRPEFTFEALEKYELGTMDDEVASLFPQVGDAIIEWFNQEEAPPGQPSPLLRQEMVRVGQAILQARDQGVNVEDSTLTSASLYARSGDAYEAARTYVEQKNMARSRQATREEKAWDYAASRVEKVLGDEWRRALAECEKGATP